MAAGWTALRSNNPSLQQWKFAQRILTHHYAKLYHECSLTTLMDIARELTETYGPKAITDGACKVLRTAVELQERKYLRKTFR
ncbi:hypothetical protein CHS0354_017568 [Potamilus streckersoni]|uniref:Uncharacterized protein n=1 Tax=Potamilus streckersoni TaxID=2493646 RepID=A0AAE0VFU6_9BIVA|nr:hypothetical protein CHS0354_017568 [Potamilus streckersoni]